VKRHLIRITASTLVAMVVLVVYGAESRNFAPSEVVSTLALGWCGFVFRVFPRVTVTRSGIVTALICLVPLTLGLHAFLRWFVHHLNVSHLRIWRFRWTAFLLFIVLLMFVAGIAAAGVGHQLAWLVAEREDLLEFHPYDRYKEYQLKDAVFALKMLDSNPSGKELGPAATFDEGGRALHSWLTLVLPYMDSGSRTDHIDKTIAWNDPRNARNFKAYVPAYRNPAVNVLRDAEGYGLSHYAGNSRILGRKPTPIASLTNGLSNTLLIGEAAARFRPWGEPLVDRDPTAGLNTTPDGFASPTGGAVLFVFADGSVRRIGPEVDPDVLRALAGIPRQAP
jgi:Protein of unknown function (DUF1559)